MSVKSRKIGSVPLSAKSSAHDLTSLTSSSHLSGSLKSIDSKLSDDIKSGGVSRQLAPYQLMWSFGVNKNISILNLTNPKQNLIFYASCHTGVLYDYKEKAMKLLQGHKNPVSSITSDRSGKWVATADAGNDNSLVVWDAQECIPIFTLFNPYKGIGFDIIKMSENAKYLITVHNFSKPIISMWLWTYGNETASDTLVLDEIIGKIKCVEFHPIIQEYIVLTCNNHIVFVEWKDGKLTHYIPEVKISRPIGYFTESVYVPRSYKAMSATLNGSVVVWSTVKYNIPYNSKLDSNIKKQVKVVHLQKEAITVISAVENVIVTGNVLGHIRFYDHHLRLLFWCQKFHLDPLTVIKFHRTGDKGSGKGRSTDIIKDMAMFEEEEFVEEDRAEEDRAEENEALYRKLSPTDASLKSLPFRVPDFITFTTTGQVGIVDFLKNTYKDILYKSEATLSAIDSHPESSHICVGNTVGRVCLYNYKTNNKTTIASSCLSEKGVSIRSLKFAPNGFYIACGMDDGSLYLLHPLLLTTLVADPFQNATAPITKIRISSDSKYVACVDDSIAVSVYYCNSFSHNSWKYLGKQRSHYKPIQDILFVERKQINQTLLSLSEDRNIAECDLNINNDDKLTTLRKIRIEQSAIPLCMTWYPKFTNEDLVFISNSEHKYKLIDYKNMTIVKTVLGPTFESPVSLLKALLPRRTEKYKRHKQYMAFATKSNIGIQILPIDGNPFKYVNTVGHPPEILDMCVSFDNKHLFTISASDYSVFMWQINLRAALVMEYVGGTGLKPYYSLLEGGHSGLLFSKIKEFFYYAQIFHQSSKNEFKISNKIPICSLSDVLRACGYYPTDYEIEIIINEIYRKNKETQDDENTIEFEDFVRLYINHRPASGISTEILRNSFQKICDVLPHDEESRMSRERFLSFLEKEGECISREENIKILSLLISENEMKDKGYISKNAKPNSIDFVPKEITFELLSNDILGIVYNIPESYVGPEETVKIIMTNVGKSDEKK